jgi:phosphoribosyl-AMP cyclohydrolase
MVPDVTTRDLRPGDDLVARCVERIRRQCPDAVAVLFGGSRLRGEAGPFSDVDFDVIVPAGPREDELGWFETVAGRLVRVSVWLRDADRYLADEAEPQDWAFGLPCVDPYLLCWAADEHWKSVVDRPAPPRPAGPPELGHLVGDLAKVGNARVAGDPLALRLAAQDLGRAVLSMLLPLNVVAPVTGRYAALRAAAGLAVAPPGYRDDLLTCLGLADEPADVDGVHAAAARLAIGVLDLAAARVDAYAGLLPADQLAGLRDGTLRRYAAQVVEPGR